MPNTQLKAFQKNAVQSYFERQQQQHQQKNLTVNESTIASTATPQLHTNQFLTTNQNDKIENGNIPPTTSISNKVNSNMNSSMNNISIRPQSLPVNKTNGIVETMAQTRLSLPNKLSQIINITTHLAAQKAAAAKQTELLSSPKNTGNPTTQNATIHKSITRPVELLTPQTTTKQLHQTEILNVNSNLVMTSEQGNLQSVNESGVPPPPPRRSNRAVMPVRRCVFDFLSRF